MRAAIYVPDHGRPRWEQVCMANCTRNDDQVSHVVVGAWTLALTYLEDGTVEVIVVARRDHIPQGGLPGIRVVDEDG
jgi:hypothetical protein